MGETKTVGYRDILKIANCRKLLFSNFINRFGDSIDAIAFTWLVYQLTGSATWSAIIFGLNQLPGIVVLSPVSALLTPLVSSVYMKDADFLSIIMVGQWGGAIIASLILPKLVSKISFDGAVGALGAIAGIGVIMLSRGALVKESMIFSIALGVGSMFVMGVSLSLLSGLLSVEFVKKVDPDYMARCSGAFNAVATASLPLGAFLVTVVTVKLNADSILLYTGVLGILIFGGIYFAKKANMGKEKNIDAKQSIREHQSEQEADASYPGAVG